jgi:four helix bundle protein
MEIKSAKQLVVYQKAFGLAMAVFEGSKKFPSEEKFSLTSQIRRSSRSVCLNLREAWAKRRYEAHFISKLTDCAGECAETDTALDFALTCGYITPAQHSELVALNVEVGKMLTAMLRAPEKFILRTTRALENKPAKALIP